ncbi:MAG: Fic family protein [Nanoarchaeota archaeon]|nr:Fic family protein [Nanoarchaeota archaeon]
MIQLNDRQKTIAQFIKEKGTVANHEISIFLSQKRETVSRITLIRDLNGLLESGEIRQVGKGRNLKYEHSSKHPLLENIDIENYLSEENRNKTHIPVSFNHETLDKFDNLLNEKEIAILQKKNDDYRKRIVGLSPTLLKKEFERITIELSWKSSKIEGNTYSLIDTEMLIKEHKEAKGHSKEEATMILNHKKSLDYIFSNKERFKDISLREVENVHRLLTEQLDIKIGIRSRAVGITGSHYRPLDNNHQISEALEKTIKKINSSSDPWSKALIALVMIAYIQPFEDGNKRTSRIIANACLIANDACPLSLRSIDETEYKKAITVFYELQNASYIKKLFLEQFDFAVKNYFL